jgi:hypothetical protein
MSFVSTAAVAGVYELIVNPTPALTTASSTPRAVDAPLLVLDKKTRVLAVTEVFATARVPRAKVDWPIRALAPDLIDMPLPAVPRTRFPLLTVKAPVVKVNPAVPLGVNVNPTAAFDPVPVNTFPDANEIAVAAVEVANVPAVTVTKDPVVVPRETQLADPAATEDNPNQAPLTLLTHNWPIA